MVQMLTVDVQYSDYLVIEEDRNHNFWFGGRAAGDVPFEGTHVLHHDCSLLLPSCSANALSFEDFRAGGRALELSQSQKLVSVVSVDPVKPDPPPLEL